MKHLHLILATPRPLEAILGEMPALAKLLARAAHASEVETGQAICAALGVARQQDWPLAPLLAMVEGLDAERGYWLRADPVAFEIGMNGLLLRRPQPALNCEEAAALAAVLGPDLAALGADLFMPDPLRWYLRLPTPPRLVTLPLEAALDRSVPPDWLTGEDAPAFLRLMNGAQICLHQHPLNRAREASGGLPVNGLWLWGGGVRADPVEPPDAIWGDGLLARALALASGLQARTLPANFSTSEAGRVAAVFEGVDPVDLDRTWFAPLISALRWARLRRLSLSITGVTGRAVTMTAKDLWTL